MASWESIAFISSVKYLSDSVIVYLNEYHAGYRRADGTRVDDKYLVFKTIWKPYFKKYISEHFAEDMLVHVKGDMLPYEIRKGETVDGYTVIGEHITKASFPRSDIKKEQRMIKESMAHTDEQPDIDAWNEPDF